MAEDLAQRVNDQVPVLLEALKARNLPAVDGGAPGAGAAPGADAARDHWWVQVRDGGKWVDLDPAAPGDAGALIIKAAKTTPWPARRGQEALPLGGGDCHEVVVRVVIEHWKAGKLRQTNVLEHVMRPAELFGQRVVLTHVPMDWPHDQVIAAEGGLDAALSKQLLAQHEWVPVLRLGSLGVRQSGFSTSGDVITNPDLEGLRTGKRLAGKAGGATGLFGGLPGGGADAPAKTAGGVLTAEWLEYEFRVPGRSTRTVRRDVFDLVGPAARAASGGAVTEPAPGEPQQLSRALALFGRTEILPLACQLSPAFVQHLAIRAVLAGRAPLMEMVRDGAAKADPKTAERFARLEPLPPAPYAYALARAAFSRFRDRVYLDCPNLVVVHVRLARSEAGQWAARTVLDIVANDVAVMAAGEGGTGGAGAAAADAFRVRLEQGVLDTNAEVLALGGSGGELGGSAAEMLRQSAGQDARWVALREAEDVSRSAPGLTDDARTRVRAELEAGRVAVVPAAAVTVNGRPADGWWSVDPATGHTLGMTSAGGSVMSERLVLFVSFAWTGYTGYVGCVGASGADTDRQAMLCAACALIAAVLAVAALSAAFAAAGVPGGLMARLLGATNTAAGTLAGVVALQGIGGLCSLYGAYGGGDGSGGSGIPRRPTGVTD